MFCVWFAPSYHISHFLPSADDGPNTQTIAFHTLQSVKAFNLPNQFQTSCELSFCTRAQIKHSWYFQFRSSQKLKFFLFAKYFEGQFH